MYTSKYSLAPNFAPHPDLASTPDPNKREQLAKTKNAEIRAKILQTMSTLGQSKLYGQTLVAEARNILEDLLKVHNDFKYTGNPYPESAMIHAYYQALHLVNKLVTPGTVSVEEHQKIMQEAMEVLQEPEVSFLRRNFMPIVVGGSALFLSSVVAMLLLRA